LRGVPDAALRAHHRRHGADVAQRGGAIRAVEAVPARGAIACQAEGRARPPPTRPIPPAVRPSASIKKAIRLGGWNGISLQIGRIRLAVLKVSPLNWHSTSEAPLRTISASMRETSDPTCARKAASLPGIVRM